MKVDVQRIDHFGIIAGTIKDVDMMNTINEQLGFDEQEKMYAGETVAGMILNGLGFVNRSLMLTPQFFEDKPVNLLLGEHVSADLFNRHKLGRVLDKISDFGCEKLFSIVSLNACIKEGVDMTFGHADTTSYSLTGQYDSCSDTERVLVKHGHSKDFRPDLKQVVQELVTTNDGGIPFLTKTFSGNSSDTVILRERAMSVADEFSKSQARCLLGDSKLYCTETAKTLNNINFITRVPMNVKQEKEYINKALCSFASSWTEINENYKFQEFYVDVYGIVDQRWIVVFSQAARTRSLKTLTKTIATEETAIKKALFHLQAQRFSCKEDAQKELDRLVATWKYHIKTTFIINAVHNQVKKGRPKADATTTVTWKVEAEYKKDQTRFDEVLNQRSCFVLATNLAQADYSAEKVLEGYKGQDKTEKGFAFLKGNDFLTSSLFLKKQSRIEALLMIMILSLLIYSIAQRRLRMQLALNKETFPNQIKKEIKNPTMHWIFQLFEGINYVMINLDGVTTKIIQGLNHLRNRVIGLLSPNVQKIYQISTSPG